MSMPKMEQEIASRTYGPPFTLEQKPGSYAWWYLDGVSPDHHLGIVIIGFIGNPFSPFYARALHRGLGMDPLSFAAINVVLYRGRQKLWTFTEMPIEAAHRRPAELELGSCQWRWNEGALTVTFNQSSPILGLPLVGQVRLHPEQLFTCPQVLNEQGGHQWWPVAPCARLEVSLTEPSLSFSGAGYHDANWGDSPLVDGFHHWQWSRCRTSMGTSVLYDAIKKSGQQVSLGHLFRPNGCIEPFDPSLTVALPRTRWLLARNARVEPGQAPRLLRTLESSPFYARSLYFNEASKPSTIVMHESLDLDRLRRKWICALFYLRMRRATAWASVPPLGLWARICP